MISKGILRNLSCLGHNILRSLTVLNMCCADTELYLRYAPSSAYVVEVVWLVRPRTSACRKPTKQNLFEKEPAYRNVWFA